MQGFTARMAKDKVRLAAALSTRVPVPINDPRSCWEKRTEHLSQVQTIFAGTSQAEPPDFAQKQVLHIWLVSCACQSHKIHSPRRSVAPGLVQAPNSFCTDKHTFVSPVVCWLWGGISQEEQGRAARIITSFWIQRVTNLSWGRCSRHHPAAVCLAVWHATPTSLSKPRNSSPLSPPIFVYWGLLHGKRAVRDGNR